MLPTDRLLFIKIFLSPVFLLYVFSRQGSCIEKGGSGVIFVICIALVLTSPVLKHGLLILSDNCRLSLPAGIQPHVWAVG
jgi:hypothetical protein